MRVLLCVCTCVYVRVCTCACACKCVHSAFTTSGIFNKHKRPCACLSLHSVNRKPLGLTAVRANPPKLRCSRLHSQASCSRARLDTAAPSVWPEDPQPHCPALRTILSDVLDLGTLRKLCFSILSPGRGNGGEGAGGGNHPP